ncbi:MAG TPA: SsrA-binding protein SmpB [Bacteroidales bacterium]|nr:SsrA-binding protein SmpB [Bacteroidales bacterium]
MSTAILIKNKKAAFEYFLLEEFTAGIQLTGTEIKSIRTGKVSFVDSFCVFEGRELYVKGLHISEYSHGTHYNHDPKRDRKLLLTARELKKLATRVKEKGFTIVPVQLYINEKGFAKLDIALARGKHTFDKRDTLKQKDLRQEMQRGREREG